MEVLVVIAIAGTLAALLFIATRPTRSRASYVACVNNLKQVGLALQNYHDTFKSFPPGWVIGAPTNQPQWGWGAMVLPFMEQQLVFAATDAWLLDAVTAAEVTVEAEYGTWETEPSPQVVPPAA